MSKPTITITDLFDPVTHENGAGITRVIEELAAKAGMKAPKLFVSGDKAPPLYKAMPAFAFKVNGQEPAICLSQDFLDKMFGAKLHDYESIGDELKAILAHEMGHIHRGDIEMHGIANLAKYPPLTGLFGAVAALAVFDLMAAHKHDKDPDKHLEEQEGIIAPTVKAAGYVAKYLTGAAVGLAGGVLVKRAMHHHMEYACDAFSKKIMGSGEPMAAALKTLETYMNEATNETFTMLNLSEKDQKTLSGIFKFIENIMHPTIEKRVSALV